VARPQADNLDALVDSRVGWWQADRCQRAIPLQTGSADPLSSHWTKSMQMIFRCLKLDAEPEVAGKKLRRSPSFGFASRGS